MDRHLKIFWAENSNKKGGRFILAESFTAAVKIALNNNMVKDIDNLGITEESCKYQDTNIKEIIKPGIYFKPDFENGKKIWIFKTK